MSTRNARQRSVSELTSSDRVKNLVVHYQNLENNTNTNRKFAKNTLQKKRSKKISRSRTLNQEEFHKATPASSRSPLSPLNSTSNTPISTPRRKKRKRIQEDTLPAPATPSGTNKESSGGESKSPIKRQKTGKDRETPIHAPRRRKARRSNTLPTPDQSRMKSSPSTQLANSKSCKSPTMFVFEEKEKIRLQKLRESLKEFYATEQTYWKNLLQMQSVFYFGAQSILSPKQLKTIFGNSSTLLLHSQGLLFGLREIELELQETDELDHTLFRRAALLLTEKMNECLPNSLCDYKDYCKNYEEAHLMLLSCDTRESKFHQFLSSTQKNQVLNLYDSLILPVQRIPRYQMLLQAVQKYFQISPYPEDADIVSLLEDVIQLVVAMNVAIDKTLKSHGNEKTMKSLSALFLPEFADFFNPSKREYQKKGKLTGYMNIYYRFSTELQDSTCCDIEEYAIFMFSDIILVAVTDPKIGKLRILQYLSYENTFFVNTNNIMDKETFELVNPACGFTFFAQNRSELSAYKSTFDNALNEFTTKNPASIALRNTVVVEEHEDTNQHFARFKTNQQCSMNLKLNLNTEYDNDDCKSGKSGKVPFSPLRILSPRKTRNNTLSNSQQESEMALRSARNKKTRNTSSSSILRKRRSASYLVSIGNKY